MHMQPSSQVSDTALNNKFWSAYRHPADLMFRISAEAKDEGSDPVKHV